MSLFPQGFSALVTESAQVMMLNSNIPAWHVDPLLWADYKWHP
jgi:hypothetical protein